MDRDHVSIIVKADEIGELVRVNRLLRAAMKEGDIDNFSKALKECSADERVSLSNIIMSGPSGNSLLHIAAGIENADILQALLEVISDKHLVARPNYQGDTALHVAARAGRIPTAELLLGCEVIVDTANDWGNTALHEAVNNRHYELTRQLLSRSSRSVYQKNKQNKSPLYLAVETGNLEILVLLMQTVVGNKDLRSEMLGMPPAHAAVMHRRVDMLKEMLKWKKELFYFRDDGGGTPLHLAAYVNYVDGVKFLVHEFASSVIATNREGYLPIHVACQMDHLETILELLQHWPYPEECLNAEGQNILHVAAMYGAASVVKYILGDPKLEKLINAKDKKGNAPLHVATLQWQTKVLLCLTRDDKVDLELVNNHNLTALDIADERQERIDAPLHQSLTRIIVQSAGTPRSKDKAICQPKELGWRKKYPELNTLKDQANTRMIVATLIATMTFAAGFSVPGGYNSSKPDPGIATLLNKPMYDVFVICNSVALYSSIIAVVILLWTQINDQHAMLHALGKTRLPLLIALATMSVAFMVGVYVTVSKRTWIAIVALIIGITALFIILCLFITLFIPLGYRCRLVQRFADYIIRAAISISRETERRKKIASLVKTERKDEIASLVKAYGAYYPVKPLTNTPDFGRDQELFMRDAN